MTLKVSNLKDALETAFDTTEWNNCANLFADAIDDYVKSGTVKTIVTATVNTPSGSYSETGEGKGSVITTTTAKSNIISSAITAFGLEVWEGVAEIICPTINTLLTTATVTTKVTGPTIIGQGTGPSGCITPIGYNTMESAVGNAFTTTSSEATWEITAEAIANALHTFIISATITTSAGGTIPSTWSGPGTGSIE